MAATTTLPPTTSAAWQTLASSSAVSKLPYRSKLESNSVVYTERDVYIDPTTAFASKSSFISVYADVIGFKSTRPTITIPASGAICLYARVISSSGPLTLVLNQASSNDSGIFIYASQLNQPLSYVVGSNNPVNIDISPSNGRSIAQIFFNRGVASLEYSDRWDQLELASPELTKMIQTQLRIASILFWTWPAVARDITNHVARVTTNSPAGALLNMQANALGQQLVATALEGPSLSYPPVLTLDSYKSTLDGAINVAAAFEDQFNRFTDIKLSVQDQLLAWDAMVAKAQDSVNLQTSLTADAAAKWSSASDVLSRAEFSLRIHQLDLQDKQARFQVGLEMWKIHKTAEAAFQILVAVVTFAAAVGMLCIGDPEGLATAPQDAEKAIKAATTVAKTAATTAKKMNPDTMEQLKDSISSTLELLNSTIAITEMMQDVTADQTTTPPGITAEQSAMGSADMENIVSLAAWDKWILEADNQLAFAVDEKIDDADTYRLELRKHAIDGKLVTQARIQAARAGQEYCHLQLGLRNAQADLKRLSTLRTTYQGQVDAAEQAREAFYDRMMMIRTSVLIQMRKATWAYKYLSLKTSKVSLDPLKSINDLRADALLIVQEVQNWQEGYSSDFSPYTPAPVLASELSPAIQSSLVSSLKTTGKATLTLTPTISTTGVGSFAVSGPFTNGSHFRVQGLRAYLVGARVKTPASNGTGAVTLTIASSGVYYDVDTNKVLAFTMSPLSRPFKYNLTRDGDGDTGTSVLIDSFIVNRDHVDPTPFTQWTITIRQPELLDLTGLRDVKLQWQGSASFNT